MAAEVVVVVVAAEAEITQTRHAVARCSHSLSTVSIFIILHVTIRIGLQLMFLIQRNLSC